jgi:hypothetical protein
MPGKQIGEFSAKCTSITISPGLAGSMLVQSNWEGPVTGFGTMAGTLTAVGGPRSGTCSYNGVAFLDNGDGLNGTGSGTYESSGSNRWRTQMIVQFLMAVR